MRIPKSTRRLQNSKVNYLISEFQSQLVDLRILKSTDLITHFVIPTSTS